MEIVAICDKLAHAGRQVSDDSALNRLLTLVDSSEPLKLALVENSTRLLAIADKVMAIGDELPDKNVVFILSIYGILTECTPNQLVTRFIELFNGDWFAQSGSLRNVWLAVVVRVYRSGQLELAKMIGFLTKLSGDNSLFVRRLASRIWAEIIDAKSVADVSRVLNEDGPLAKEVLIQLKLQKRLDIVDLVVDQLCLLNNCSFVDGIKNRRHILMDILPVVIDAALLKTYTFSINYPAVWETVKVGSDVLLQFKVYLLCPDRPSFDNFISHIVDTIETQQTRPLCILLDACSDHIDKLDEEVELNILAQLQNRRFETAKVINVASRFCSLTRHTEQGAALIVEMMGNNDDKLKSRLILKLRDMAKNGVVLSHIQNQLHLVYSDGDDEVKDSVLELVMNSPNDGLLISFKSQITAALESEAGFIRATAIKCTSKTINSTFTPAHLATLAKLTSSDLDYTVRRAGIASVLSLFRSHPAESFGALMEQKVEQIEHDTSSILHFRRPSVSSMAALVELLAFDDDWEVKLNVVKLIELVHGMKNEGKNKRVTEMVDLLDEMTHDCDPFVAGQAKVALNGIM